MGLGLALSLTAARYVGTPAEPGTSRMSRSRVRAFAGSGSIAITGDANFARSVPRAANAEGAITVGGTAILSRSAARAFASSGSIAITGDALASRSVPRAFAATGETATSAAPQAADITAFEEVDRTTAGTSGKLRWVATGPEILDDGSRGFWYIGTDPDGPAIGDVVDLTTEVVGTFAGDRTTTGTFSGTNYAIGILTDAAVSTIIDKTDPAPSVLVVSIDTAASMSTATPKIGEEVTGTPATFVGDPGTLTNEFVVNGAVVATGTTYTPQAADDGGTIRFRTAPTVGPVAQSGEAVITYNAATAAGGLADQTYSQNSGPQTVDAAVDFTGAVGGEWSVSGVGATIDQSGEVTITTDTVRTAASVVVTYTNSGGEAQSGFSVTVEAAVELSNLVITGTGTSTVVDLEASHAGRLYWRAQTPGADPDGPTIVAGGGLDSGFVDVVAGANDGLTIDIVATGTVEVHFVLAEGGVGGDLSNVVGGEIDLTTTSWSITDNGDGSFDIASAPPVPAALTITDNGDGTFDVAA